MEKKELQALLRQLPSIDLVLSQSAIRQQIEVQGAELVSFVVRSVMDAARNEIRHSGSVVAETEIFGRCTTAVAAMARPLLKGVVNATGIVIHTNLGRAPLGPRVFEDMRDVVLGYSNLEYDLENAERGERNAHVVSLIRCLTGAEDAVVANNNAAGLMLALSTFAQGREVIVSRGELVEIGGSFRIPDILAASGALMVEVGTTNKTRLADYEKAITANTALILKVHRSNFDIVGFTEEVALADLADCAHRHGLPCLYDIGSGLIRRPKNLPLAAEPDVKSAIADGADLVAFSGDKLLGGPQSGIVVGRAALVGKIKKAPMMRALRVDKLILAALASVIRSFFTDAALLANNPLFGMLEQSPERLQQKAECLQQSLAAGNVAARVVDSIARCGGGTLPLLELPSFAVVLVAAAQSQKARSLFAERVFAALHRRARPVVGILRQGEILFDVLTLSDDDLEYLGAEIPCVLEELE